MLKKEVARRAWLPLLLLLLLWGAAAQNRSLMHRRVASGLTNPAEVRNSPPMVAFTVVLLGGFRGIVADMLWIRVSQLQEQGEYFELVQLADWITKLEPRCSAIWGFHGWNLAYNVSAAMGEDKDRWRWVRNGIRLLRDEGLRYNPADPSLYRELGWIFQHKIGDTADTAHPYYKQRWAGLIEDILPEGALPPDIDANAPEAMRLHNELGLRVQSMQALEDQYGRMDWRHPNVHSLYWALEGLRHARGGKDIACERMVYQSLAALFFNGRLRRDEEQDRLLATPRFDLFATVCAAYESALARYDDETVLEAYFNFLLRAVGFLQAHDQQEQAQAAYRQLHQRFPNRVAVPEF